MRGAASVLCALALTACGGTSASRDVEATDNGEAAAVANEQRADDDLAAAIIANRAATPAVNDAATEAADDAFLAGLDQQRAAAATAAQRHVREDQARDRRKQLDEIVNGVAASGNEQ